MDSAISLKFFSLTFVISKASFRIVVVNNVSISVNLNYWELKYSKALLLLFWKSVITTIGNDLL